MFARPTTCSISPLIYVVCGSLTVYQIEQHASPDVCVEARIEVVDLTKAFIVASPASFLLPRRWSKYQSILHSVVGTSHSALYQDLRKRNMRLQALAGSDAGSEVTISQTLLQIYDSMAPGLDLANVARTTWEIPPDPAVLVRTSLCWSSSIYKTGCARIYTAARLLRSWSELGINIETAILNFLAVDSKGADLDKASLYRVIAELIRSRHFAVGTYLNWVIANGSLRRCGNSTKVRYKLSKMGPPQFADLLGCFPRCGVAVGTTTTWTLRSHLEPTAEPAAIDRSSH